jgi:hypothetical protein
MYNLNFKSVVVRSADQIPTKLNGKYNYSMIEQIINDEDTSD